MRSDGLAVQGRAGLRPADGSPHPRPLPRVMRERELLRDGRYELFDELLAATYFPPAGRLLFQISRCSFH
jgi:hypothetical protein